MYFPSFLPLPLWGCVAFLHFLIREASCNQALTDPFHSTSHCSPASSNPRTPFSTCFLTGTHHIRREPKATFTGCACRIPSIFVLEYRMISPSTYLFERSSLQILCRPFFSPFASSLLSSLLVSFFLPTPLLVLLTQTCNSTKHEVFSF